MKTENTVGTPYDNDLEVRAKIDECNKEINESLAPIMNATDCTVEELKACVKREKQLQRKIKKLDSAYYIAVFMAD